MQFLVYKLTNSANGKSYIGITSRTLGVRWGEHCKRAREGARLESRLYSAMRKYGADSFTREVIATLATEDEAREAEKRFILELGTYAGGYNANEGGHGHLHFPEHIRRKIGDAQRGKIIPAETRDRMSSAKAGQPACADHLGEHTEQGETNPRAKSYVVQTPTGRLLAITGLRAFCRENGLALQHMTRTMSGKRNHHKGYVLLSILGSNSEQVATRNQVGV